MNKSTPGCLHLNNVVHESNALSFYTSLDQQIFYTTIKTTVLLNIFLKIKFLSSILFIILSVKIIFFYQCNIPNKNHILNSIAYKQKLI